MKLNKIDKYLILLFAVVLAFTAIMIAIFMAYQSTPDTLIVSVFGLAGGECGVLGLIKHAKERNSGNDNTTSTTSTPTITKGDDVHDDAVG